MQKYFQNKTILRIIDANLNRSGEGLRVVEEFARFIINNRSLSRDLKTFRHELSKAAVRLPVEKLNLVEARNSQNDVGKDIIANETQRDDYRDIICANLSRIKESIRVLEEFSKLISKKSALDFKELRYGIYDIEKKIFKKIKAIRNFR